MAKYFNNKKWNKFQKIGNKYLKKKNKNINYSPKMINYDIRMKFWAIKKIIPQKNYSLKKQTADWK